MVGKAVIWVGGSGVGEAVGDEVAAMVGIVVAVLDGITVIMGGMVVEVTTSAGSGLAQPTLRIKTITSIALSR